MDWSDSLHAIEVAGIAASGGKVSRASYWELRIHLLSGRTLAFKTDSTMGMSFRYAGYLREIHSHVVHRVPYEDTGNYLVVDDSTGDSTTVWAMPVPSPDGARFALTSLGEDAESNVGNISVWRMVGRKPQKEFSIDDENWDSSDAVWRDSVSIDFTRNTPVDQEHPFTYVKTPARLSRTGATRVLPASVTVLPSGYTLTDTTNWGNANSEEGQRAVLRRGREIIETVDLAFGVLAAGRDSLVFLPIRTDSVGWSDGTYVHHESSPTEHVLWTPQRRRKLSVVLPLFNADFSSPTIADKLAIDYWGFSPDSGEVRVYAMRYDFRTTRLDSLFLRRERGVATDYRWVYGVPQINGTEVSFDGVVLDRKTWRVVRKDTPSR
jgi:hypothetical protein